MTLQSSIVATPDACAIASFTKALWQIEETTRRVVAWTDGYEGSYRNTRAVDGAEEAAEFICKMNAKPAYNVAITPTALLPSATSHTQENFQQAHFACVDLNACGDEPELQQRLLDRYGQSRSGGIIDAALELPICQIFPPSMIVITGTTGANGKPHKRGHLYWRLTEPCRDSSWFKVVLSRLIDHFCADRVVKSVTQLLRVGGTIAYGTKKGRPPVDMTRTVLLPDNSTSLDELSEYLGGVNLSRPTQNSSIFAFTNTKKLTDGRERRASDLAWKHVNEFAQHHSCLPEVSDVIAGVELDWRAQCCTEAPSDSSSRDYSDPEWLRGWLEQKCQDKINALQDQGWADTAMQGHFGQQHEPPRFALKLSGEITLGQLDLRFAEVLSAILWNRQADFPGFARKLRGYCSVLAH